mmetsp:Transcript_8277/g.34757  ORF Transcript_8277/g.34757 Transcript_8277/m.34757 type:complete len:405 (-) Transcript_8277:35-1249(-)
MEEADEARPSLLLFFNDDTTKLLPKKMAMEHSLLGKFEVLDKMRSLSRLDEFLETRREAVRELHEPIADVVISMLGNCQKNSGIVLAKKLRKRCPKSFIVVFSRTAAESPGVRMHCFDAGCNMVTYDPLSLQHALDRIYSQFLVRVAHRQAAGSASEPALGHRGHGYACPNCRMRGLSEDMLCMHGPLYHCNEPELAGVPCPVCASAVQSSLWVHLHNKHGPIGRGEEHSADAVVARPPIYSFALVVCRNPADGRYLVVQEFCNKGYWLPGGGVDSGEDLCAAAVRETLEEAGVCVELKGVLRLEHTPRESHVRLRAIFYAEPLPPAVPKSIPDYESVGASWIRPAELRGVRLRGREPVNWIHYLEEGGLVYPLSLISGEHTPVERSAPFSVVEPASAQDEVEM